MDELVPDDVYWCHEFNTFDAKKRIGLRDFLPVYTTPTGLEKFTKSPKSNWSKYLMDYKVKRLLFHPFALVGETGDRIPDFISRKLHAGGFISAIFQFPQLTTCIYDSTASDQLSVSSDGDIFMLDCCPYL